MKARPIAAAGAVVVATGAATLGIGAAPAAAGGAHPAPSGGCPAPSKVFDRATPAAQRSLSYGQLARLSDGAGVTVAVIDTGVDGAVPQLSGRVRAGHDLTGPSGASANTDCLGRGTALASIVAAGPTKDAGFIGMAPAVTIDPIRVVAPGGSEEPSPGLIATAIRTAVDDHAQVVLVASANLPEGPSLSDALGYAVNHDALVVAPLPAPQGQVASTALSPAVSEHLLTVAAVGDYGSLPSTSTSAAMPDLVAPGKDVVALSRGGDGTVVASGDAYAAAFVAAAAALVRSYHPDDSVAEIMRRLEVSAIPVTGSRPEDAAGWGAVSPYDAVSAQLPTQDNGLAPPPRPVSIAAAPARASHPERGRALWVVGAGLTIVTVLVGVSVTVRARRRRGEGTRPAAVPALGAG